ncbi:MAG: hypothetical protein QGH45_01115, partial [Myxococcota bacterium]|nr:hypothetical protein [Myxococcota bacterium]
MRRSLLLLAAGLSLFAFAAWAITETWPLDDPTNYDYDPSLVAVESGTATMIPDLRGTGADGDLEVISATFDLSTDVTGLRTVADGASWPVSATLLAGDSSFDLDGYVDGLAAGDELLLIDLQGAVGDPGTGSWELLRVQAIAGATVSVAPLTGAYDGTTHAVVAQRVPNYDDVTLTDGLLAASGFDGSGGGIVAFRARGTLTVDDTSTISADGLGYAGGAGGLAAGGGGQGGDSYAGIDGDGGNDDADGVGAGGAGEGPSQNVAHRGGPGGIGAGGGGADGTDNADDGAGGGGGGGHAGGGGGGAGGTGCGSPAGDGGWGAAVDQPAGGGGASSCPGGDGGE